MKRFRKAQPYDASIVDMNKNVMIGREFVEMQTAVDERKYVHIPHNERTSQSPHDDTHSNQSETEQLRMRLYREVYEI